MGEKYYKIININRNIKKKKKVEVSNIINKYIKI